MQLNFFSSMTGLASLDELLTLPIKIPFSPYFHIFVQYFYSCIRSNVHTWAAFKAKSHSCQSHGTSTACSSIIKSSSNARQLQLRLIIPPVEYTNSDCLKPGCPLFSSGCAVLGTSPTHADDLSSCSLMLDS